MIGSAGRVLEAAWELIVCHVDKMLLAFMCMSDSDLSPHPRHKAQRARSRVDS